MELPAVSTENQGLRVYVRLESLTSSKPQQLQNHQSRPLPPASSGACQGDHSHLSIDLVISTEEAWPRTADLLANASIRWPAIYPARCSQLILPGQLNKMLLKKACQQGWKCTSCSPRVTLASGRRRYQAEPDVAAKLQGCVDVWKLEVKLCNKHHLWKQAGFWQGCSGRDRVVIKIRTRSRPVGFLETLLLTLGMTVIRPAVSQTAQKAELAQPSHRRQQPVRDRSVTSQLCWTPDEAVRAACYSQGRPNHPHPCLWVVACTKDEPRLVSVFSAPSSLISVQHFCFGSFSVFLVLMCLVCCVAPAVTTSSR